MSAAHFRRLAAFWFKTGSGQRAWRDYFNNEYAKDHDFALGA